MGIIAEFDCLVDRSYDLLDVEELKVRGKGKITFTGVLPTNIYLSGEEGLIVDFTRCSAPTLNEYQEIMINVNNVVIYIDYACQITVDNNSTVHSSTGILYTARAEDTLDEKFYPTSIISNCYGNNTFVGSIAKFVAYDEFCGYVNANKVVFESGCVGDGLGPLVRELVVYNSDPFPLHNVTKLRLEDCEHWSKWGDLSGLESISGVKYPYEGLHDMPKLKELGMSFTEDFTTPMGLRQLLMSQPTDEIGHNLTIGPSLETLDTRNCKVSIDGDFSGLRSLSLGEGATTDKTIVFGQVMTCRIPSHIKVEFIAPREPSTPLVFTGSAAYTNEIAAIYRNNALRWVISGHGNTATQVPADHKLFQERSPKATTFTKQMLKALQQHEVYGTDELQEWIDNPTDVTPDEFKMCTVTGVNCGTRHCYCQHNTSNPLHLCGCKCIDREAKELRNYEERMERRMYESMAFDDGW